MTNVVTAPAGPVSHASGEQASWMGLSEFRVRLADSLVPLKLSTDDRGEFRSQMREGTNPTLNAVSLTATPHTVERTRALVERSSRAFFKVSLMLSGSAMLVQEGRESSVGPGDLLLYDTSRTYTLQFSEEFSAFIVMIPRPALRLHADTLDAAIGHVIPGTAGAGEMIVPFLERLADQLDHLNGPGGRQLASATVSMLESLIADRFADSQPIDQHSQVFRSVVDFMTARIDDPDLNVATIADAHFMSERALYKLFRARGLTVASSLREKRLERSRIALMDGDRVDEPIGAIAAQNGYRDLTSFSRAYRTYFGESPLGTRHLASIPGDSADRRVS